MGRVTRKPISVGDAEKKKKKRKSMNKRSIDRCRSGGGGGGDETGKVAGILHADLGCWAFDRFRSKDVRALVVRRD